MSSAAGTLGKAAEYRRLADHAHVLEEASVLANDRDKHARSAAKWTELAELAERASAEHQARVSAAPTRPTESLAQGDGLTRDMAGEVLPTAV
jgi:hypothetical protein